MLFINNKPKYFPYYTNEFNNYLLKSFQKKRTLIKKKAFMYVLKTVKNANLSLNSQIEISFLNFHTQNAKPNGLIISNVYSKNASFQNIMPLLYSLKKDLILVKMNERRQFYFFFKEITSLAARSNGFLLNANLLPNKDNIFKKKTAEIALLYSKYFTNIFSYNNSFFNTTPAIFTPYYLHNFYTKIIVTHGSDNNNEPMIHITPTFINASNFYLRLINTLWNMQFIDAFSKPTKIAKNIKRVQKSLGIFFGSVLFSSRQFKKFDWNSNYTPNKFIWKTSNKNLTMKSARIISFTNKKLFIMAHNHQYHFNKKILIKKKRAPFLNFSQVIYTLLRLEEKIHLLAQKNAQSLLLKTLINLYNYLNNQIIKKQNWSSANNLLLSNSNEIFQFKKTNWHHLFTLQFKGWLEANQAQFDSTKLLKFYIKLRAKLKTNFNITSLKAAPKILNTKKIKLNFMTDNKQANFFSNLNLAKKTYLPKSNVTFINKKLSYNASYLNYTNIKKFLKVLTNKNIQIFYINALSLTKYAFNYERVIEKKENRSPTLFLQNIDRDLINKYKYIGIYIKDLIRICFIGMFLKKPQFIAKFLAFQISKLPRNRKETSFIRFIIKVVKTFAAEREEILGLRIKFKGRVNRWRRTKSIIGSRGVLPLHTIDNFIECGSAQAVNRKGALGIRIWIWYKPEFSVLLNNSILKYFLYSKHLEKKKQIINHIPFTKKIN
jgi:hypothetical protein